MKSGNVFAMTPPAAGSCLVLLAWLALTSSPVHAEDLPFVFQAVPQTDTPGSVFGGYAVSYGRRATPPLAPDGVEHAWFAGFHALDTLSARLSATLTTLERLSGRAWRLGAEVRQVLLRRERFGVDLGVTAGYLRELDRAHVVAGSLQAAGAVGSVEVAGTVFLEKAFAAGRDAVDVIVTAGAAYPLASFASIGLEYQGQDLEDLWEREEAEGGARHLLGPTATFRLFGDRVAAGLGVAAGLTRNSPDLVARTTILANF